mgnify:CR=1 FL=1
MPEKISILKESGETLSSNVVSVLNFKPFILSKFFIYIINTPQILSSLLL